MSRIDKNDSIFVAGHRGLVGSAIVRQLAREGYSNVLTRTHQELDLEDQSAVREFFAAARPKFVFLAAAKVGGIHANNTYPADFIYKNLAIECNVIHSAFEAGVTRLLFFGSTCIYPKLCPQPIKEDYLLTGPLEPTNEPYAVAKIAGAKMCEAYNRQYGTRYTSVMPTNLYGPNDNFDLKNSHVLPALIRKTHEAKINGATNVTVWGTGKPKREFLYVDDMAEACVYLMEQDANPGLYNIGVGKDIEIAELINLIKDVVGFEGRILFDRSKPDGTPRKLLDVSRMAALGWRAKTSLRSGIEQTYKWYLTELK
jgi:GDP-L-fucose synthase